MPPDRIRIIHIFFVNENIILGKGRSEIKQRKSGDLSGFQPVFGIICNDSRFFIGMRNS